MEKKKLKFKNNIKNDSNNQIKNFNQRKQPKEVIFDSQNTRQQPNSWQAPKNNNYQREVPLNQVNMEKAKQHQDVDKLVSQFIPEYHEKIAIELKNVSLSFKISNDKIDNLKEYVIRTIKRNKEKTRKFKALDNVSFKIYQGEKVG